MAGMTLTTATASPPAGTSTLFAPTTIAGLSLRNAFAMAPMTRSHSPRGVPTAENAAYYRRRAAGGVGLIVTEGILVDHPSAGHDHAIPRLTATTASGWRSVVDAVHAEGSAIVAQLWHMGSEREPTDGVAAWTPSGVDEHGRPNSHAVTLDEVDLLVAAYADAARTALAAGFDGVEVHAAHGYLLDEFLWPATNRRTDRYGGAPRARARIVAEIVAAIRAATSPTFPIVVRFSQFKERAFDARVADTPHELGEILGSLAAAGADALHASQRRFWEPAFPASSRNLAGWAKLLTGLPTITVGSVGLTNTPERLAELGDRHAAGEYDLVAVGRALLGNPAWVDLIETGRIADVVDYTKAHERHYW